MRYFTIEEFCNSETAKAREINNTPTKADIKNIESLVHNLLDPLRERYGKPIRITSGYRSLELNRAVKGTPSSQHLKGCAADIVCEDNKQIFNLIKENFEFDQLINESNFAWIHVSFVQGQNRRQILAIP